MNHNKQWILCTATFLKVIFLVRLICIGLIYKKYREYVNIQILLSRLDICHDISAPPLLFFIKFGRIVFLTEANVSLDILDILYSQQQFSPSSLMKNVKWCVIFTTTALNI